MNEFEKAVNTDSYTGEMTQECVIEWLRGQKEVTVTFAGNTRYNSKVRKLAEQYPDEVKIVAINSDNSVVAHLPLSYIKVSHPRTMSEEAKIKSAERLNEWRENNLPSEDSSAYENPTKSE